MKKIKFSGLRAELGRIGWKQKDLAIFLSVSEATIHNRLASGGWKTTERRMLSKKFGKTIAELFA